MKSTYTQKKIDAQNSAAWHLVDATDIPVGRLATEVATLIRGKHKPTFTPSLNCGDFVVVVNAEKVRLTGRKMQDKIYYNHTGYAGGMKAVPANVMLERSPERIIETAVFGMIRRGALGHQIVEKLKVYKGSEHPHAAQNPQPYAVKADKK